MADAAGGFYAFKQRVIFSLFRAAARVGVRLRLPLGQMEELFRLAYFREARVEQQMVLPAVAELFGKSLRTVASVHKTFQGDFFSPENQVAFRRELVRLADTGPQTTGELHAAFPDRPDVDEAVDDLVREGKLLRSDDVLRRNPASVDFFDDPSTDRQIDGLNRQMDVLCEAVWKRLLERDEQAAMAVGRTYVFTATRSEFEALALSVQDLVRSGAIDADAHAQHAGIGTHRAITWSAVTLDEETD